MNYPGDDGVEQGALGAHSDPPKNHSDECNPTAAKENEWRKKRGKKEDGHNHSEPEFVEQLTKDEGSQRPGCHSNSIIEWNHISSNRGSDLKVISDKRDVRETGSDAG